MRNIFKHFVSNIYNEIKYSDRTARVFTECAFTFIGILLFILYKANLTLTNFPIIFLLISWSILAILGFFIPVITQSFTFSGVRNIPIVLKASSKGGFIAGQKIQIKTKVVNLPGEDTKKRFRDTFEQFDIIYFKSVAFPIQKTKFLEGEPSCGGASINIATCKGQGTIAFNAPGRHTLTILYKAKGDNTPRSAKIDDNKVETALTISPAENYVQFRFFSITYGLTLLVLLIALISLEML